MLQRYIHCKVIRLTRKSESTTQQQQTLFQLIGHDKGVFEGHSPEIYILEGEIFILYLVRASVYDSPVPRKSGLDRPLGQDEYFHIHPNPPALTIQPYRVHCHN